MKAKKGSKHEKIIAAAMEVGGAEKARYVESAVCHYSPKELTSSKIEQIFIEAGFDYSLAQVMGLARAGMSSEMIYHYRKQGL